MTRIEKNFTVFKLRGSELKETNCTIAIMIEKAFSSDMVSEDKMREVKEMRLQKRHAQNLLDAE